MKLVVNLVVRLLLQTSKLVESDLITGNSLGGGGGERRYSQCHVAIQTTMSCRLIQVDLDPARVVSS